MTLGLSFILPCFNVERYITDCLNSIYDQGLPEDEFEVICVNDCSTDGTGEVVAGYAEKHSNLTLVDHEQNLTAGGARNTGIRIAKGEYIWFVDPDDMIKDGVAIGLLRKAMENDLDILFFNNDAVDENSVLKVVQIVFGNYEVMTGQDFIIEYFPNRMSELCIVWRGLFKTEFLRSNHLWYPQIRKAQDVSFLWKTLLCAKRVGSVSDVGYVYRINPYSVLNIAKSATVFFSERLLFGNEIVDLLKNGRSVLLSPVENELYKALNWCANSNLSVLSSMSYVELERYYQEIVCHRDVIERVKPYMNRKSKSLYSTGFGKTLWIWKVRLLGRMK
jgi:glycosyltransferase involved in cell wall biosynthesis